MRLQKCQVDDAAVAVVKIVAQGGEILRPIGADAPEIVVTHPIDPDDNLALVDQLASVFASVPGLAERAAALDTSAQRRKFFVRLGLVDEIQPQTRTRRWPVGEPGARAVLPAPEARPTPPFASL